MHAVHNSYTYIILLWQMHVHYKGCAVCFEKRNFSEAMTHYVYEPKTIDLFSELPI